MPSLSHLPFRLACSILGITAVFAAGRAFAVDPISNRDPGRPTADAPNILFIFADDQCFDTIAALGNEEVLTPNLDKLARRGVSFRNAYNMGGWNGAICVASRTMMNTGRFLWNAHETNKSLKQEAQAGRLLSLQLSRGGYETFFSGKWHVSVDANEVFDHVKHVRPGMPKTVQASYQRPNDKGDWTPWDKSIGGFWEGGKHWSEVLVDDAEEFMTIAAGSQKPFFMYLAFNAPHDPRQSPREFIDMYDVDRIEVPKNMLPEYPHMKIMGAGRSLRDEKLAPWPRTAAAVKLHRQEYFALITHMDRQIGRILESLKSNGLDENTYIVFTADHGLACGQHGLLGKQNMYEHSMKAPLLVVGPGIPSGKQIETPVYIQDFATTAVDWAGIQKPDHFEFKSLLPIINGDKQVQYEHIYGAYIKDKQRMIREGDYKLIYYPGGDIYRLFNVAADPHEMHDLAESKSQAPRLAELKLKLEQLMKEMNDPLLQEG
ncbi:MAG TPA: choline-sulfatase [Planctomycetaceae bacterium]|nr:choline-sulfatase [Planctomycetaceae bacterium]